MELRYAKKRKKDGLKSRQQQCLLSVQFPMSCSFSMNVLTVESSHCMSKLLQFAYKKLQ